MLMVDIMHLLYEILDSALEISLPFNTDLILIYCWIDLWENIIGFSVCSQHWQGMVIGFDDYTDLLWLNDINN